MLTRTAVAVGLTMTPAVVAGCCTSNATTAPHGTTGASMKVGAFLPPSPTGFAPPVDIAERNRDTIFEQINGGSFSFLENGMVDALFATFPVTGTTPDDAQGIAFELYRFNTADGARKQFEQLNGEDGKPWEGATAVVHDYGVELTFERVIVRATFNDGPEGTMGPGAEAMARSVLAKLR